MYPKFRSEIPLEFPPKTSSEIPQKIHSEIYAENLPNITSKNTLELCFRNFSNDLRITFRKSSIDFLKVVTFIQSTKIFSRLASAVFTEILPQIEKKNPSGITSDIPSRTLSEMDFYRNTPKDSLCKPSRDSDFFQEFV